MALGQVEKIDEFVAKRRRMAELYTEAIGNVEWLRPQKTPAGDVNSHFCFAMRLTHESVTWEQFRQKHIEFGGDGIYAAWTLCYLEDSLDDIRSIFGPMGLGDRLSYTRGLCPTAERIQGQLMQLTTNQKDESEMQQQAETLARVVRHFS
jgi:perosamine synthetase